ncbi:MAG: hypothetical protein K0U16_01230, partial [Gammaproteobacteria bacterium]|nr:hypothetical protein [Gammaproteobacteria bacterium]
MSRRICHQVLNQMDGYLSKKPFVRPHWWSRRWIVYMTIQPPLTETHPLWKRNQDELRLLRLFNVSPEELGRKIERYWKKPRWRRWFASFGMNKKIDVWNYYQRCLAYKEISQNNPRSELKLVTVDERKPILEKLGLALHQSNVKFEAYLEKHCRHSKWVEKFFLSETKRHQQRLKKSFLAKLDNYLKQLASEGERTTLRQQAEQEYQQVEAFMFHYNRLHFNALCRVQRPEVKKANQEKEENTDRRVEVYNGSPFVSPSSRSFHRSVALQNEMRSLDGSKKWLQSQKQSLNTLIQKDSPEEIEKLLQSSLNEIKNITEPQLDYCETIILRIEGDYKAYDSFLEYLERLQNQLKPLLKGGLHLFHPDHVMNLTHSQKIWSLITHYSQAYIEQSRFYLECLRNYHQRIEKLYNQHLQKQMVLQERAELKVQIKKLQQSLIELDKKLEQDRQKFWEKMYVESEQFKATLAEDRAKFKATLAEDSAKFKATLAEDSAKFKATLAEDSAKFKATLAEDSAKFKATLAEDSAKFKATRAQDRAEFKQS